jgi:hypothetical protein
MTYSEFLLSESVSPVKTNYGTDLSNEEIIFENDQHFTFFKMKDLYYLVGVNSKTGEIYFGTSDTFDTESEDNIDNFDDTKRGTNKLSLRVFNNVFYVLLEILKDISDIKKLYFNGANKDLENTYSLIVKNKFFLEKLKELGYNYKGKIDNNFTFRRK